MLDPKPLTEDNYKEILEYLKYSDKHMSLTKFSTLYIWKHQMQLEYDIQDDFLFMFEKNFNNVAYFPYGTGDIDEALLKIKKYQKSLKTKGRVGYLDKNQKELLQDKYQITENRKCAEYIYEIDKLIDLKGRRYHKKRNHINKFCSLYEYEYASLTSHDLDEILDFLNSWAKKRGCEDDPIFLDEKHALKTLIKNNVGIDFKIGALKIDNKIAAFSVGEQIADDMAVIHFEKADVKYKGIYSVIVREFLEQEWRHLKYINRQEDLGIPGLRKSKKSYHPQFLIRNYSIRLY